ncbi:SGNH/GDSL hydrolase family protein [Nocardioides humilatus]|uniref:SGNH/GDSL hydrolase family protein n=1 Tax=Nocardioides humilatus TaxID=2607660 RepID=UPI00165F1626|nr:SGNH/GDSL hydrolase family protein [Nocardioides humilatus]
MRIVLLGDSHLDYADDHLALLGDRVLNAAVGGASVDDLPGQARGLDLGPDDVVVLSVGTNDAAPWKQVPIAEFGRRASEWLRALPVGGCVVMTTPGVDEARLVGFGDRTNQVMRDYAGALCAAAAEVAAEVVDAQAVLAPLGSRAYVDDGVHLTDDAYRLLLPVVAEAVGRARSV